MLIHPMLRCLCLWKCLCECIGSFATTDASDTMCQTMSKSESSTAGLISSAQQQDHKEMFNWFAFFPLIMAVIFFFFILGKLS